MVANLSGVFSGLIRFMVLNVNFNNISVILWRSALSVEKTTDLSSLFVV